MENLSAGMQSLLERGGPWEVMPEEQPPVFRAAQQYLARHDLFPEEARRRVREVWIEGKYRGAYIAPRSAA